MWLFQWSNSSICTGTTISSTDFLHLYCWSWLSGGCLAHHIPGIWFFGFIAVLSMSNSGWNRIFWMHWWNSSTVPCTFFILLFWPSVLSQADPYGRVIRGHIGVFDGPRRDWVNGASLAGASYSLARDCLKTFGGPYLCCLA